MQLRVSEQGFLSAFLITIDQHTVNRKLVMQIVGRLIAETYMDQDIGKTWHCLMVNQGLLHALCSPFDMHQLR